MKVKTLINKLKKMPQDSKVIIVNTDTFENGAYDVNTVTDYEDGNVVGREYSGELIRCKDCKHRPKLDEDDVENDTVDGFSFEFPDFKCPCHCEDPYYNWMPEDDWYCGNGERKEE